MPLSLKKIKMAPVDFEDFTAMPQVNQELRLRLQNLKFQTEAQLDQAKDVLSSAFPEEKAQVRKFLDDNFVGAITLQELQAYLLGGEASLVEYRERVTRAMDKAIEKSMEEVNEIDG